MMWRARSRHTETETCKLRRWLSEDGQWALVHIKSTLGLPPRWLLLQTATREHGEYVVSSHRTRKAAEKRHRRLRNANR